MQINMDSSSTHRGAALFVALIILLIVSFMGVSAMRGSLFGERMAFNTQAREMSFQAAETAINGVIAEARGNGALLNDLLGSHATRTHCIGSTQQLNDGACAAEDSFDGRDVLRAQAESTYGGQRVAFGSDTSTVVDYQFVTYGRGDFVDSVDLDMLNRNRQEWRKLGPPGPFEVTDTSLITDSADEDVQD